MLPDESYVRLIGELAYRVSALEWLVLGDLEAARTRGSAISGFDVKVLMGKTTGEIAREVRRISLAWTGESGVQRFALAGAAALSDMSGRRNHVLHARPATHPETGQPMLLRDRWKGGGRDLFWIDEYYLYDAIVAAEQHGRELERLRVRP